MTSHNMLHVAAGIVSAVAVVYVVKKIFFSRRLTLKSNPRDLVVLHQIGRGPHAPSLSPFPLKVETYLRMAKIPYQSVHSWVMSSKGTTPWIEYNDVTVAGSAFCVEFINDKMAVDLNAKLSAEQRAVSRAFDRMAEDGILYWSLVLYRWVYPVDQSLIRKSFEFPLLVNWLISRTMRKAAWAQGSGRHSMREVDHMLEMDITAISHFLGEKLFLFGDTATEIDCTLFGFLCQPRFNMCGLNPEKILQKFPNLMSYCDRIKSFYWPDWNEKITHGKFSGVGRNTVVREEIYRP